MMFKKDEEESRVRIICGPICRERCLPLISSPGIKNPSFLLNETPREVIHDNLVPFGESIYKQIRGALRMPVLAYVIFHVPTA